MHATLRVSRATESVFEEHGLASATLAVTLADARAVHEDQLHVDRAITFSNRWFPTKAIRVCSELHEFERLGMVIQWLNEAGFGDLHTFSSRGWARLPKTGMPAKRLFQTRSTLHGDSRPGIEPI